MKPSISEQTSAKAAVENSQIVLTIAGKTICRIPIKDLKLIGEYTTAEGPVSDDWFIVFMTSEADWNQISQYTPGMPDVLKELGIHLKSEIIGWLAASTSWKTNIIRNVKGQEMWDIISDKPVTAMGRLKQAIGLGNQRLALTTTAASVFHNS